MMSTAPLKCHTEIGDIAPILFGILDSSNPRVPVKDDFIAFKSGFLADLTHERRVHSPPAYYVELLSQIHWASAPSDAAWCGYNLLICMGQLSEAMGHHGIYEIPVIRAVEIMFDFLPSNYLVYFRKKKQWWV